MTQGKMFTNMKSLLVLLLIMLKEVGPTAACSSSCSSRCYCYNRGLSSVPQDLPTTITTLDLDNNVITTLNQSDFSRYSSLTFLDLSSNQISVINSGAFHNLGSLRYLYLYNNQLTNLTADTFKGLGNLERLYLYRNNISSIETETFHVTPQLRYLRLEYNYLKTIAAGTFVNLHQLQHLHLQNNNIRTSEAGALVNLTALQTLDLSHNNISTFPMEAASNLDTSGFIFELSEWPRLSINDNQMETLPSMAYDILVNISNQGANVYITNNPWQCDCKMLPFKQRMTGFPAFEKQIGCVGPDNLAGKSLLYLVDTEDLNCEETGSVDGTSLGGFSVPLFLSSLGGVLVGAFLTSAVYSAAWCKIRRRKTAPNPVKYPRYRYARPRTAPSPELDLTVVDADTDATVV